MKKLFLIVPFLIIFAFLSINAVLANHNNQCKPGFHLQNGICVHNGNGVGNCGQDQGQGNNGNDQGNLNNGSCNPSPTASASASPSILPSPTESPEPTIHPCNFNDIDRIEDDCPTASPSPAPTVTPEPTEEPKHDNDSHNPNEAPSDPACEVIKFTPTAISATVNSSTSDTLTWTKVDSFVTQYVVFYGTDKNHLVWNTGVITPKDNGNGTVSFTINNLPANTVIWWSAAGVSNGCQGKLSEPFDP